MTMDADVHVVGISSQAAGHRYAVFTERTAENVSAPINSPHGCAMIAPAHTAWSCATGLAGPSNAVLNRQLSSAQFCWFW
jgi:hypothetical protein